MPGGSGSASCIATTRSTRRAKGWANHATVMGYYLHRIKNERTLYRGQEIRGGTHSFLRGKAWHLVASDRDDELTYRITPEDFSPTEYPLKVSLDLTYRIEGTRIYVVFQIQERRTGA